MKWFALVLLVLSGCGSSTSYEGTVESVVSADEYYSSVDYGE